MKKVIPFHSKAATRKIAIQWLVKLEDGDWEENEKTEFLAWYNSNQKNQKAFLDVAKVWGQMDVMNVLEELFPLNNNMAEPHVTETQQLFPGWLGETKLHWAAGLSACTAIVIACLMFLPIQQYTGNSVQPTASTTPVYTTQQGEQSVVALEDGSVITLNTSTNVQVQFSGNERAIYMESGEAYFEVAKDPSRPFTVYAGRGKVAAIGTAFSVRINKSNVDVVVAEGTVKVTTTKTAEPSNNKEAKESEHLLESVTLNAMWTANYQDTIETFEYIQPEKIETKIAWKDGKWSFQGETLEHVINETNRYTKQQLQITDPTIAQVQVGGRFDIGDVEQLLQLLEASFGIEATQKGEMIYLSLSETAKNKPRT